MPDLNDKLPLGERNALLILFSEENQRLKTSIASQQQTIDKLTKDLETLRTSMLTLNS